MILTVGKAQPQLEQNSWSNRIHLIGCYTY